MLPILRAPLPQLSRSSLVPSTIRSARFSLTVWKLICNRRTRRPGILVLINDADWELEGEEAYELKSGDNILFVSTLHGG